MKTPLQCRTRPRRSPRGRLAVPSPDSDPARLPAFPTAFPIAFLAAFLTLAIGWLPMLGCGEPEPPLQVPATLELRIVEDAGGGPVAVDAVGVPDDLRERLRREGWGFERWSEVFAVTDAGGTPVVGDYRLTGNAVRFIPEQPFSRGSSYLARWNGDVDGELAFEPSKRGAAPSTQVAEVYPSSDLLPQNLSRLHIQFTAAMKPGGAGRHVRLVAEDGGESLRPFVRASAEDSAAEEDAAEDTAAARAGADPGPDDRADAVRELWNDQHTRVTLLLDVGDEGRPLLEIAGRYRLVVDRGWEDARGVPLRDTFEKVVAIAKRDRDGPDPAGWKLSAPVSRGAPLVIDFPAPLDRIQLEEALEVRSQEAVVPGRVRISNEERRWTFSPQEPWRNGRYVVRVVGRLSDPAGNTLGGAPQDPAEGGSAATGGAGTVVPFVVDLPDPPRRR